MVFYFALFNSKKLTIKFTKLRAHTYKYYTLTNIRMCICKHACV